jgi:hypothetical protein
MKKLLIVSLVLGMLFLFSGVASAAPLWWQSGEITSGVTLTDESTLKNGNTVLVTKTGTFKGYVVAETTAPTPGVDGGTIGEIFLCGTVTTGTKVTDVEISVNNFALVATDHDVTPIKAGTEAGDIIATGTFTDQTNTLTGPAYLNAKATFDENNTDTITSIIVSAVVAGGYLQNSSKAGLFSGTFSTDLKLYTGATPLTCVGGKVQPVS